MIGAKEEYRTALIAILRRRRIDLGSSSPNERALNPIDFQVSVCKIKASLSVIINILDLKLSVLSRVNYKRIKFLIRERTGSHSEFTIIN